MAERVLSKTDRPEVAEEEEEQRALVPEGYSFQVFVLQVWAACSCYLKRKIKF